MSKRRVFKAGLRVCASSKRCKLKSGDYVEVISGKDSGKRGRILKIRSKMNCKQDIIFQAKVDNICMCIKHKKQSSKHEGGKLQEPRFLDVSNLVILDEEGNPSRIGYKNVDGKRIRSLSCRVSR